MDRVHYRTEHGAGLRSLVFPNVRSPECVTVHVQGFFVSRRFYFSGEYCVNSWCCLQVYIPAVHGIVGVFRYVETNRAWGACAHESSTAAQLVSETLLNVTSMHEGSGARVRKQGLSWLVFHAA
ncbi:hypothetical protein CFELI_07320 [Corynebacterium felinum]|uniref:Uncharacterized protein n=1 Tax=Corynebacterium felinum TaxID=131318 RepID=A0ABU2BAQ9_9CORY|nr:hypothetical protein [Corynebacterium felinum]WJY95078.1 hypothetical protein CFELI_07320 [Corynebacterium felinum]